MTVGELIKLLRMYKEDMLVLVDVHDFGFEYDEPEPRVILGRPGQNGDFSEYCEPSEDDSDLGPDIIRALALG